MKNLSESVNDGLLNEAGNLTVCAFQHDNPQRTYVIKNCTSADVTTLQRFDLDYCEAPNLNGLVYIEHSDEWPHMQGVGNNINTIKNSCWKDFEDCQQYIDEEGYVEDVEFEALPLCLSFEKADKIKNANDLWKRITEFIEDSYIDGDSNPGRALVDIDKEKIEVVGGLDILFFNSMRDFMQEFASE